MAHDVFISHSSQDKPVADAACAALESVAIRCWIAPRNVQPGRTFAGEINRAIQRSKVMVLIFSAHSNKSEQVLREVQLASNSHLHIVQFRIQDVIPNDDLEYYLSAPHWLDALLPPLENHLERLKGSVKVLLQMDAVDATAALPPVDKDSPSESATKFEEYRALPPSRETIPAQPSQRNRWIPALVAAFILCAILLGLLLLQLNNRPKTEVRSSTPAIAMATPATVIPSAAATAKTAPTVVQPPFQSSVARREPEQPNHVVLVKGAPLFSHNFETASPIIRPLFGTTVMSVRNARGEGQITGRSPGILPAMFDRFLLDDFIVECDMRADNAPPGARYGFIFRAADVRNGGIARYYALMLDPDQRVAAMSWWMETKWKMNAEQPVPTDLLQVGRKSHIALKASGNRFRAFVDEHFVAEFSADGLKNGRIGLCLSGVSTQPWIVHFDNFQIFLPP
jgi:hypothetical protein